jgi:hypothetical protein
MDPISTLALCFLFSDNLAIHVWSVPPLLIPFNESQGYVKDLQVEFDISGRYGQIAVGEVRGRLKKNISIRTSPCVSPLIYVGESLSIFTSF